MNKIYIYIIVLLIIFGIIILVKNNTDLVLHSAQAISDHIITIKDIMFRFIETQEIIYGEDAKKEVSSVIKNFDTKNIFKLKINNWLIFSDSLKKDFEQLASNIFNANSQDFIAATINYLIMWEALLKNIIKRSNEKI